MVYRKNYREHGVFWVTKRDIKAIEIPMQYFDDSFFLSK
jgi:hypothetical protein